MCLRLFSGSVWRMSSDSFLAYAVSCSLVDLLDKPLLVQLRDGKKLIGALMSATHTYYIANPATAVSHDHKA